VERLKSFIESEYGKLDILINNAGISKDGQGTRSASVASVFRVPPQIVREIVDTNAIGAFIVSRALVPLMRGEGRVVNVSSGMGQLAEMNGGWPGYRMSKAALNALTRILADELKDTNVKVNSVCPGWVRTDLGGSGASRSIEQGVDTIVWLATLPPDGPSGGFFRDRKPIAW